MTYTPVELRHVHVSRSLFGYNRATVEQVIEEVADSFEVAWRERGELTDQVHALEEEIKHLKGREELLTHTLVGAEQVATDVRDHARREAERILAEAHTESRSITRTAHGERERLFAEIRRIEALLRAALAVIQEGVPEQQSSGVRPAGDTPRPVEQAAEERREDTREFNPVALPPVLDTTEGQEHEPADRPLRRVVGGDARDFDWGD